MLSLTRGVHKGRFKCIFGRNSMNNFILWKLSYKHFYSTGTFYITDTLLGPEETTTFTIQMSPFVWKLGCIALVPVLRRFPCILNYFFSLLQGASSTRVPDTLPISLCSFLLRHLLPARLPTRIPTDLLHPPSCPCHIPSHLP